MVWDCNDELNYLIFRFFCFNVCYFSPREIDLIMLYFGGNLIYTHFIYNAENLLYILLYDHIDCHCCFFSSSTIMLLIKKGLEYCCFIYKFPKNTDIIKMQFDVSNTSRHITSEIQWGLESNTNGSNKEKWITIVLL